jgi:hypothetical protein
MNARRNPGARTTLVVSCLFPRAAQGRPKPPAWFSPDENRATRALRIIDNGSNAIFIGI